MKTSELFIKRMKENNGRILIYSLNDEPINVYLDNDNSFRSDKLRNQSINPEVLDIIVDFLKQNHGKAIKGGGRNDRVGYGKCSKGTIMYEVATKYYDKFEGESTFDPLFVLCAILDWLHIARKCRGYIELY